MRGRWCALALCALSALGCGSLDVTPEGTLPAPVLVAAVTSEDSIALACDRLGNLYVNGRALDLPLVREDTRLGLRLVDASWLPPVWRPAHAREGGYLVTRLHAASPLAVGGLRPLDRVLSLDGQPLGEANELAQRLRDLRRRPLRLEALHPDQTRFTVEAAADERVGYSTQVHVPFLFERRSSSQGESFACGPLDTLFYWRSRRQVEHADDATLADVHYSEDFEWGALTNFLGYRRRRDPVSGEERSQFTLFWVFQFGDDL